MYYEIGILLFSSFPVEKLEFLKIQKLEIKLDHSYVGVCTTYSFKFLKPSINLVQ
jgi:hypothetical protein